MTSRTQDVTLDNSKWFLIVANGRITVEAHEYKRPLESTRKICEFILNPDKTLIVQSGYKSSFEKLHARVYQQFDRTDYDKDKRTCKIHSIGLEELKLSLDFIAKEPDLPTVDDRLKMDIIFQYGFILGEATNDKSNLS